MSFESHKGINMAGKGHLTQYYSEEYTNTSWSLSIDPWLNTTCGGLENAIYEKIGGTNES
jgi:hypothetical protein